MSTPRTPRLVVAVCAVAAGLLAAVVLVIGAVGLWEWAPSPIEPPTESQPLPASTAPQSPITPDVSTAVPMHLRGPR